MHSYVAGAGGFIGGHLVKRLVDMGHEVTAVDIKPVSEWWQRHSAHNIVSDVGLSSRMPMVDWVFNLAADMGGMGFIAHNKVACMRSAYTSLNLLATAEEMCADRYFFASSACVYPGYRQEGEAQPLSENLAYPADPEDGYGWEKLFSERLTLHYAEEERLDTRVARFHNVYGPYGTYQGGREKAPAALCRKVWEGGTLEIWGDGMQQRSFLYIDDCIDGIIKLMESNYKQPVNIGSEHAVTINELAGIVMGIAGKNLTVRHVDGPRGVQGRNSDNTRARAYLGWDATTPLTRGLEETYKWIAGRLSCHGVSTKEGR